MKHVKDDIFSYWEMCREENVQVLQRGMNYRLNPSYSVFLMSQRHNAPYRDKAHDDGIIIEYEGHDVIRRNNYPKNEDQQVKLPSGKLTQNGLFIRAIEESKKGIRKPETVKIYEKIKSGIWTLKGYFDLIDYKQVNDGNRNVFVFTLKLSDKEKRNYEQRDNNTIERQHTRMIPSQVKLVVWKRDEGKCVLCGSNENLHFDHDLPFSKGGTSLTSRNIRLLCMKHNLQKSAKIE